MHSIYVYTHTLPLCDLHRRFSGLTGDFSFILWLHSVETSPVMHLNSQTFSAPVHATPPFTSRNTTMVHDHNQVWRPPETSSILSLFSNSLGSIFFNLKGWEEGKTNDGWTSLVSASMGRSPIVWEMNTIGLRRIFDQCRCQYWCMENLIFSVMVLRNRPLGRTWFLWIDSCYYPGSGILIKAGSLPIF